MSEEEVRKAITSKTKNRSDNELGASLPPKNPVRHIFEQAHRRRELLPHDDQAREDLKDVLT